ncbi:hypothetical protein JCM6882_003478 [Rhodosporidiobolus microsporus]
MLKDLRDVMRWIWEDEGIQEDEVAWLAKCGPALVYLLVREHAMTLELHRLVLETEEELVASFSQQVPSAQRPFSHRASTLLDWLNEPRSGQRKYRFFCRPDGSARKGKKGEEPWQWYVQGAGNGSQPGGKKELDEWEDRVREEEGWGRR